MARLNAKPKDERIHDARSEAFVLEPEVGGVEHVLQQDSAFEILKWDIARCCAWAKNRGFHLLMSYVALDKGLEHEVMAFADELLQHDLNPLVNRRR